MSEKNCKLKQSENVKRFFVGDDGIFRKGGALYSDDEIAQTLNEQQSTIIELQEIIIELKDDKNQLHKVISKLRQEVAELKTRNAVLSSKLNQIPENIKEVWLE